MRDITLRLMEAGEPLNPEFSKKSSNWAPSGMCSSVTGVWGEVQYLLIEVGSSPGPLNEGVYSGSTLDKPPD